MPLQLSVPTKEYLELPTEAELKGVKELLIWDDRDRAGVRALMRRAERLGVTIVAMSPAAKKYMSVVFTGA